MNDPIIPGDIEREWPAELARLRREMGNPLFQLSRQLSLAQDIHTACFAVGNNDIEAAVAAGMIPKDQLVDGQAYIGQCRDAHVAIWNAERDTFMITRFKWGREVADTVDYPAASNTRWDVFIPIALATMP
jgi:hypothetical protein